jgi:hypothetical protein
MFAFWRVPAEKPVFLRVRGLFWEALGVIWGQFWSTLAIQLLQEGQVGAKIRVLSAKRGHGGAKAKGRVEGGKRADVAERARGVGGCTTLSKAPPLNEFLYLKKALLGNPL